MNKKRVYLVLDINEDIYKNLISFELPIKLVDKNKSILSIKFEYLITYALCLRNM